MKHKDPTIPSYVSLMNSITIASMKAGNLELADGTRITTEEQRLVLMEELRQCVIEGGCMIVSDWVGVRPSESHEALASENRNPLGAQHHG